MKTLSFSRLIFSENAAPEKYTAVERVTCPNCVYEFPGVPALTRETPHANARCHDCGIFFSFHLVNGARYTSVSDLVPLAELATGEERRRFIRGAYQTEQGLQEWPEPLPELETKIPQVLPPED
jgi:hypothetical protein